MKEKMGLKKDGWSLNTKAFLIYHLTEIQKGK